MHLRELPGQNLIFGRDLAPAIEKRMKDIRHGDSAAHSLYLLSALPDHFEQSQHSLPSTSAERNKSIGSDRQYIGSSPHLS